MGFVKAIANWRIDDIMQSVGNDRHAETPLGIDSALDLPYDPDADPLHCLDVYWPREGVTPLPAVIHLHGGAFVAGDRIATRRYCQLLALRGFVVFNVDYRRIDGRKIFLEDVIADVNEAVRWIDTRLDRFGADRERVFLTGTSSGALMAVWMALIINGTRLGDALGLPKPGFTVKGLGLHCGMLNTESRTARAWGVRKLAARHHPRGSPVYDVLDPWTNHDLRSLPPVFLDTSDEDFMKDMTYAFARLLDDNRVEHRVMDFDLASKKRLVHGFAATKPELPESVRVMSAMVRFFGDHTVSGPAAD